MTALVSGFGFHTNHCANTAAATSAARISMIMDTARILAVSVFVCLISLVLVVPLSA
jgi:hypothetical protein